MGFLSHRSSPPSYLPTVSVLVGETPDDRCDRPRSAQFENNSLILQREQVAGEGLPAGHAGQAGGEGQAPLHPTSHTPTSSGFGV